MLPANEGLHLSKDCLLGLHEEQYRVSMSLEAPDYSKRVLQDAAEPWSQLSKTIMFRPHSHVLLIISASGSRAGWQEQTWTRCTCTAATMHMMWWLRDHMACPCKHSP